MLIESPKAQSLTIPIIDMTRLSSPISYFSQSDYTEEKRFRTVRKKSTNSSLQFVGNIATTALREFVLETT